jgi:hypothetical protein
MIFPAILVSGNLEIDAVTALLKSGWRSMGSQTPGA